MRWRVEQAQPSDFPAIHRVVASAFGQEAEAHFVERLRTGAAWLPDLALLARPSAQPEGPVVGFAALTRIRVGGRPALALAPVAVAPEWQGQGAGSALVRTGIARAVERGERLILVLGDPRYYGRFGFAAANPMGISGPYDTAGPAFQALVLPGPEPAPTGLAVYPDEFAGL
jgi:putative acetyltransferase